MGLQLVSSQVTLDAGVLFQRAREERRLDFDLGVIDVNASATEIFFLEMAEWRSRSYLGFKFGCEIEAEMTAENAGLLNRGGVTHAKLVDGFADACPADRPAYFSQMETVRALHEADIVVHWTLGWAEAMTQSDFVDALLHVIAASESLPPPELAISDATDPLKQRVVERLRGPLAAWQSNFRSSTLTFARGPGFLRIRDRRLSGGGCRFYTLKAQQADILLFCAKVRSRAEIAECAGDVPAERLSAFLDRMIASGLMVRHGDHHLSLPTRRTLDERWSSEVV